MEKNISYAKQAYKEIKVFRYIIHCSRKENRFDSWQKSKEFLVHGTNYTD